MYTTLSTFAHVGEQKPDNNDEQAKRDPSANKSSMRRMSDPGSPQSNNTLSKKTNDYVKVMITFANKTINNINNANLIINRLRQESHRKHRAKIKKHIQQIISESHIQKKTRM